MKNDKLHNIKSTGFKTPDNYFENFEDKLFDKLSEETSIDGIKETGFKVPDNYFETVEQNVLNAVHEKETPVIKLNSRKKLYYIAGIAASLILLFAIFFGDGKKSEEFSAEMVETYFQESDLDSYELAELLVDADILEEDFTLIELEYNEDNLESYLLENVDIESILQQ